MASKRLGRLRQWAGEVISSKEKSAVTEETRELEQDIELRRNGIERLQLAAAQYHSSISKKKQSLAIDDPDKFLPRDALGIVLLTHGEEFGEDSAFGSCLTTLGRAHCKIATLQEAFALTLKDSFLSSLSKFEDEIKDYEAERKKLETRRLNYDAALNKMDRIKGSKKDKDRQEVEDELAKAKSQYEETAEDVRARIYAIQDNEKAQLRELGNFLDLECKYAEQYLEVLRDVRANWRDDIDDDAVAQRPVGPLHVFPLAAELELDGDSEKRSHRFNSIRSHKSISSTTSLSNRPPTRTTTPSIDSAVSSEDEEEPSPAKAPSRKSSFRSRSGSVSRPPSRPASRTSRKRSDSQVTVGSTVEKEKEKKSKGIVSGWTSSWRGKKGRDRETFSNLNDEDNDEDDEEDQAPAHHSRSASSLSLSLSSSKAKPISKSKSATSSPVVPGRVPKWLEKKKLVRALYDFNGSLDELSFRTGDEIVVVNEVLEEWWLGEVDGKTGLFPTSYTKVVEQSDSPSSSPTKLKPHPSPRRANTATGIPVTLSVSGSSDDGASKQTLVDENIGDHPFGDSHAAAATPMSGYFGFETDSVTSANEDEDSEQEQVRLMPSRQAEEDEQWSVPKVVRDPPSIPVRRPTDMGSGARKAPPPPPPRRATVSTAPKDAGAQGKFLTPALADGQTGDCKDFKQNPFKATGMCVNCFRMHIG